MRFKNIMIILLTIASQAWGDEKPIAISLGKFCGVAGVLRNYDVRSEAYPFDWLITPFFGIYQAFEEDFEFFLDKKYLIVVPSSSPDSIYYMPSIFDVHSGFHYLHDFFDIEHPFFNLDPEGFTMSHPDIKTFSEQYETVKAKYIRRISRLKEVLKSTRRVIFIRCEATKEQAISLRNLFLRKYPHLNFSLVIVNDFEDDIWDEPYIRNHYIPIVEIANLNSQHWYRLLLELNLITYQ